MYDFDYIVIGSGFGGSVSALRLAEKGYSVAVIEMGRRWAASDFPKSNWNARRWLWQPSLKLFGFYSMRRFKHVMVVSGNAVGGGSITYANALLRPTDNVWDEGEWAKLADWKATMPAHYATAERMLGVTEGQLLGEADRRLLELAKLYGAEARFHAPRVGTFFAPAGDPPGKTYPDPYFGGAGPERGACVGCGGCMIGCRHNAKNTLDKNYLYFAEKLGAKVYAETRVVDVRPVVEAGAGDGGDGGEGYEIETQSSISLFNKNRKTLRARGVVFAASSLGTMELLLRLKDRGSLPSISSRLGKKVRTNSESILGVRFPKGDASMSGGLAGGASFYLNERTHIGVVRYPEGSDAIGLMMTPLSGGRPGLNRILKWLLTLVRHPLRALQVHNPIGFARQTMLLLVMQTTEAHLNFRLKRKAVWPFSKSFVTEGDRIPSSIPEADDFARHAAKRYGGIATTMLSEVLMNIPTTAHCMGGCGMGRTADNGVVDEKGRVFGYKNMMVCDGSVLSANLGVNPSLTITALTENAMSHVPERSASGMVVASR